MVMSARQLRRRCQERLDNMSLPDVLDIDVMFADLAQRRGRPIQVIEVDTPDTGPCALWVGLTDRDYILVERGTDPLHRDLLKLHEWAHIICGHRGTATADPALPPTLLPDLDPAMVQMVIGRRTYGADEEAEAEMLASMILARQRRTSTPVGQPFDGERGDDLDALINTLDGVDGK